MSVRATVPISQAAPIDTASASSVVDRSTSIDGTVVTDGDLRVDGSVHGTVTCSGVLRISEGAEVDATVDAAHIVVAGTLSGTIVCRGRLEIEATGTVRGRVETGSLVIHEGARYEGHIAMRQRVDAARPSQQPASGLEQEPVEPESPQTSAFSYLRSLGSRSSDADLPGAASDEEPPSERS